MFTIRFFVLSCALFFVFLVASEVGAQSYSVGAFHVDRVQPQQGNAVIVPAEGRFLNTIGPERIPENGIVMRRKFGKEEYGLFAGVMKEGAYGRLKAFRVDSVDQGTLLKLKIYDSPARDWYLDLDEVYFEDRLILIEGRSEIHFQVGGQWKKAVALPQPPARLSIQSQPAGARVWIDGNAAGATPLRIRGIGQPLLRIQMRLPGYYLIDEPVQIKPGEEQGFSALLVAKVAADTLSLRTFDSVAVAQLAVAPAPDQRAYVERQVKLVRLRDSLLGEMQLDVARFDRGYPRMKGKDEFEKSGEFEKRKSEYESERSVQSKNFSEPRELQIRLLTSTIRAIDTLLRPFEERRVKIVSQCPVKLGLYDADAEKQSLNLDCSDPESRYAGACNVTMAPETARRLRLFPDSLRVDFYGWNILSETADGRIVRMTWDTVGFKAFNEPEKAGLCVSVPRKNVVEAFFVDQAEKKADFYARESVRKYADSLARRDSLAAAERWAAQETERRLADARYAAQREAAAKRKKVLRTVRVCLGTALATGAAVALWTGNSEAQQAESSAGKYQNALSVQSARIYKDEYLQHNKSSQLRYTIGSLMILVSIPLIVF